MDSEIPKEILNYLSNYFKERDYIIGQEMEDFFWNHHPPFYKKKINMTKEKTKIYISTFSITDSNTIKALEEIKEENYLKSYSDTIRFILKNIFNYKNSNTDDKK